MSEDYVLYRESTEETTTFKDMDDLRQYAVGVLGLSNRTNRPDDFAIKVYMAEFGTPFEYNGEKFIVWDDEFEGYHEYHASTKKTKKSKSQPKSFSQQVAKQRAKNNRVAKDDDVEEIDEELMMEKNGYARNLRNLASRLNKIADDFESMDEYSHHYSYSAYQVGEFINEMDTCAYELEQGFKYT